MGISEDFVRIMAYRTDDMYSNTILALGTVVQYYKYINFYFKSKSLKATTVPFLVLRSPQLRTTYSLSKFSKSGAWSYITNQDISQTAISITQILYEWHATWELANSLCCFDIPLLLPNPFINLTSLHFDFFSFTSEIALYNGTLFTSSTSAT